MPDDEKVQMHMKLTHELDDLYDFDDDVGAIAVPKAALPEPKADAKSAAEVQAELDIYREEANAKKTIIRSIFWHNRSLVWILCFMIN